MKVVVKFGALRPDPIIDSEGNLVTGGGQATVARRLLTMYPDAALVGSERRSCNGFELVTLGDLDVENTLVINLDVLDSVGVFQRLHRDGAEPKIMNFQWINPSTFHHPVNFAAMGLAYSFFPTFCSGERTASEVREVAERWTIQSLAQRARIAWADLGVRVEAIQPREEAPEPIVLYPAISTDDRKQPNQFIKIVANVQKQTPILVMARLSRQHLVSEPAMRLGAMKWSKVSPLRARKDDYWCDLARTTAFLATATEEAYGLEYVEAMLAGVIGIFPNRPWAKALLPERYPYLYNTPAEAEQMLLRAVREPDKCRAELDASVGKPFVEWVAGKHNRRDFASSFTSQVQAWFGE